MSPAPLRVGADCVVVGAGVVGAAVAQRLARHGVRVVVVDQGRTIGSGCSYANAAILAPSHVTPLATPAMLREAPVQMLRRPAAVRVRPDRRLVRWLARLADSARGSTEAGRLLRDLAQESTRLHVGLADDGLSPTLRKTGAVDVYLRSSRRGRSGSLTPAQLHEVEPALQGVVAGTHEDDEWTLESRSFVTAMLDDARSHGARVEFGTRTLRLLGEPGRVTGVETDAGIVTAGHVVLAAGLGSSGLAAAVGLRLPLRGGRGHVVDVAVPDTGAPRIPVRVKEYRVVVTPLADRVRVCGSLEFGPESRTVDPRRGQALLDVACRVLPVLKDRPVLDRWSGERPCTSDGMPVIGTSQRVANLSVGTGHGMWGMILAPVTARILLDAIVDGRRSVAAERLHPDRFS